MYIGCSNRNRRSWFSCMWWFSRWFFSCTVQFSCPGSWLARTSLSIRWSNDVLVLGNVQSNSPVSSSVLLTHAVFVTENCLYTVSMILVRMFTISKSGWDFQSIAFLRTWFNDSLLLFVHIFCKSPIGNGTCTFSFMLVFSFVW